jgi:hypothetical protein
MRTTVDLPDQLLRRAKAAAALEGRSLKDLLVEALEARLQVSTGQGPSPRRRVKLPLVPSSKPGTLRLTGDTVASALAAEDLHALARH